jgi:hypothetical protein
VPKSPDKTHPYRRREVVELVNQKLSGALAISPFDIICIRKVYNIASKAEFYYKSKFASPQYSLQFVDWIVKQATKDHDFFIRTRSKANIKIRRRKLKKV